MPKLPTFSAGGGGEYPAFGGRRASSEDFAGGAAGLVQAGHTVQQAATSLMSEFEDQEARKALVGSTAIRAKYNKRLDEAALSGEDTDKIKEEMLNELGAIGNDFQTKRGAQNLDLYTAGAEISFDNEASRMKVERAAAEAKVEGSRFLNSAGANVQRDPTRLKQEEAAAEAFAESLSKLPAPKRKLIAEGLKQDLNMAAAVAQTRLDPEGTKKKLMDGEFNLSPDQRETAIHRADTEARAKRADEAYQRAEVQRQKVEDNDTARDAHFASIMGGKASQRSIMDDPRLMPATREHLIMLMDARAKAGAAAERKSDPATKMELWKRINAPEGDPRKMYNSDAIFQAVEAQKLNTTDADYLNRLVAGQKDENGRAFSSRLGERMRVLQSAMLADPVIKNTPNLMDSISLNLISQVEKATKDARAANKNPDDLLNPDSKDYFFKPGILKATADAVRLQQRDVAIKTQPGTKVVREGFEWEFKGGDPGKKENWKQGPAVTTSGKIQ